MKQDNRLKLHFNKKINDIEGCVPLGSEGRWDINLLFYHFLNRKIEPENHSLFDELQKRGYDIKTVKFEISKQEKNGDYKHYSAFPKYPSELEHLKREIKYWGWELDYEISNENCIHFIKSWRNEKKIEAVLEKSDKSSFWYIKFINHIETARVSKEQISLFYKMLDFLEEGQKFNLGEEEF